MTRSRRARLLILLAVAVAACGLLQRDEAPRSRGEQLYGTEADVARYGALRYAENCMSCHGGATGGSMMDYPPRHNANGHTWHHGDCELKQVIRTGSTPMTEMMRRMMASPDAPRMPAFRDRLSDEEIDAVLGYIKTLWTPGQRGFQEQVTREEC